MTEIGIIGDEAADILTELYSMTEESVNINKINDDTAEKRFNILVINNHGHFVPKFINMLTPEDVLVINMDDKTLFNYLNGCRVRLITYGFSSKACATASSVVDEAYERIQFCLQRAIPTLKGDLIEPQEFAVSFNAPQNVHCALAAVTTALIAGLDIEKILQY